MFRTDKPIYKVILILSIVLIVAALVASIYYISIVNEPLELVSLILKVITLIYAIYYMFFGYSKNAALYFKFFLALVTITFAFQVVIAVFYELSSVATLLWVLSFAIMFVLTTGLDLGKKKSFIYCAILLAVNIIYIIVMLFVNPAIELLSAVVIFILACLVSVMTYAKYLDKTERGTK